jgi:hypothetical protein
MEEGMLRLTVCFVVVCGCGASPETGMWNIVSRDCDHSSWFDSYGRIEVSESKASIIATDDDCVQTISAPIVYDVNGRVTFYIDSTADVFCDPSSCEVEYKTTETIEIMECPGDLPPGRLLCNIVMDGDDEMYGACGACSLRLSRAE